MLSIEFIRENKAQVVSSCKNKNKDPKLVEDLLSYDEERKTLQTKLDALRAKQKEGSQKVAASTGAAREAVLAEMTTLKGEIQELETKIEPVMMQWEKLLRAIPNVTSPDMPVGKDDSENVVVRTWGTPRNFTFPVKDHVDIGKQLNIIDCEKSADISGSRFYYLKGDAVLLQFAVINHVFATLGSEKILSEIAKEKGIEVSPEPFVPMLPPVIMRREVMRKMDRLEPEDQRYILPEDDQVFVGSAEHTMGSYHMDETLEEAELPVRYIGYSTAFRREAGTYGKDMRGILRVHQFDKLEMESFTAQEDGAKEQQLIVGVQEYLVRSLGLPYRVVHVCTGDTGKPDYDQYDIETWVPSQNTYRETHTSDYMTDYQARRLKTFYKTKGGEKKLVYMNDATAFAISRILIAILENNQNEDGTVTIPEVLRPYMGGRDLIV
jgi:seryl-tRNA synthetase